ncbi:MAG: LPS export ABC transporter periplasmic protein LptC [Desulfuromonadales bacterium]|nr:LPS export ABC transporter periplasmic protein LptC [Desulfuromonadales bacterium]
MFNLRRILALVIVVSVVVLTTVIYRHLQQQNPEEILNMLPDNVDLALQALHYTHNEGGQRSWTLDADKAEYQRDSGVAKLDAVKLQFYHAGKFGAVELQADQGQLNQETRQVDLVGNVVLTAEKGEQLFTDQLHYDDQNRQLSTAESIRVLSPQVDLTGIGMVVDIDRGSLLIKKQVRMVLYPTGREKK